MGQGNVIGKPNLPATTGSRGLWNLREQYAASRDSKWPGYDPQWDKTTLLLKTALPVGDAFIDSSPNNFTVTRSGDTIQTTATPYAPFWSTYFDGSTAVTFAANAAFSPGTGDFTVEGWINPTVWGSAWAMVHVAQNNGVYVGSIGSNFVIRAAGVTDVLTTATLPTLNAWTHVVAVRSGTTMSLFLNGVRVATMTSSYNFVGTGPLIIGSGSGGTTTGNISNVRFIKGTAVYDPAQTTLTVPTAPLTAVSGTSLLTVQNSRHRDNSTNNFVVTLTGAPPTTRFSPFAWTWSAASGGAAYFDGSGDFLSAPNAAANFTNQNFTAEAWVWFTTNSIGYQPIMANTGTGDYQGWVLYIESNNTLNWTYSNNGSSWTGNTGTSYAPVVNAWTHIAVVRNGTTVTLYVNGTSLSTHTISTNSIHSPSGAFYAGYYPYFPGGARSLTGFMANIRLVTGTAVYTANFTPPTAPLNAVSGTSLLLNFTNPATFDTSGSAAFVRRVGNVSRGTAAPATDLTSVGLGGSGDYLTAAAPSGQLGVGDFTVEAWVFPTSRTGTYPTVWCNYSTWTTGSFGLFAAHNSHQTKYSVGFDGVYPALVSTTDIAYGQWTHLAVVRSNGVVRLYVNGVSEGGTYTSSAAQNQGNGSSFIGVPGDAVSGNTFTGLISNLRVERSARYTANFTPSRSPHTVAANTVLALNQTLDTWDLTAKNDLTSTGTVVATPAMFTGSALSLNGSQTTRAHGALSTNFGFGTGDFCIEAWIYPTAVTGADRCLWDTRAAAGDAGMVVFIDTNGKLSNYTSGAIRLTSTPALAANTWQHVAVVRVAGTLAYFINGQPAGSVSYTTTIDCPGQVNIGIRFDNAAGFSGQMDELRVTKGNGRYVGAFSPTTAPFDRDWEPPYNDTLVTSNVLQVKSIDLAGATNNVFRDDSTNAFLPVRYGDVTQGSLSPYIPSGYWSNYFDGNGDFLSRAGNSIVNFGSSNFTVEAWVNLNVMPTSDAWPTNWSSHMVVVGVGTPATGDGTDFIIGQTKLLIQVNDTAYLSAAHGMVPGRWYHIAVSRSGNTLYFFVNGNPIGTTAFSVAAGTGSTTYIGCETGEGAYLNGSLSNLRVVNGTALYTASFTPSTTPLTAVTNTSLLACQDNRIKDNSTNNFALTRNGDVSVSRFDPFPLTVPVTTVATTNPGSVYFDGAGDYIQAASNTTLNFSTGDFTVEAWINLTATTGAAGTIIAGTAAGAFGFRYGTTYNGSTKGLSIYKASTADCEYTTFNFNPGVWYHVAVVRQSGVIKYFINGTQSTTQAGGGTVANYTVPTETNVRIGTSDNAAGEHFNGYIADLRVVKSAVYTANFTPPTAPLTAITNTTLLACQNPAAFTDASTNNLSFTKTGDAKAIDASPFTKRATYAYGGSGYFDGSGDYLQVASNAGFQFDTGDFTVEFWWNGSPSGSYTQNIGTLVSGTEAGTWRIGTRFNSTDTIYFSRGNGSGFNEPQYAKNVNDGAWHHIACVRSSGIISMYVDGQKLTPSTGSEAISGTCTSTNPLTVGYNGRDNAYITGHMANVRVVKGTAVYTANFTPPTSPVTAISGTSLLLNFDNAGVYDATGGTNIVSRADARTDKTVTQFGNSTLAFDGTGDYLSGPSNGRMFGFRTGDYTVEAWIRPGTASSSQIICGGSSGTWALRLGNAWQNALGGLQITRSQVADYDTCNFTFTPGTWYHVAVCRAAGTVRFFVNGALVTNNSTGNSGYDWPNETSFTVGAAITGAETYNGYLYDLRVSRVGRYTANFTVPSEPLPVA